MAHIKKFSDFQVNEEILGFKSGAKKAYQNTIDFLEGNSSEAKKVKELYNDIKQSGKSERDTLNLRNMQRITALGQQWARTAKMEPKDYAYSQIKTVLEENFNRFFKGGADLNTAESKKYF